MNKVKPYPQHGTYSPPGLKIAGRENVTIFFMDCPCDWEKGTMSYLDFLENPFEMFGEKFEVVGVESWATLRIRKGTHIGVAIAKAE